MKLVYQPKAIQGPEPIRIGHPFNITVSPGEELEVDPGLAKILLQSIPQFKVASKLEKPEGPDPQNVAPELKTTTKKGKK